MKKQVTKTPKKSAVYVDKVGTRRDIWFKQEPKKTTVCACKVGVSKSTPKSVSCAAKATPIKASLKSVIAPTLPYLKSPRTPDYPPLGPHLLKSLRVRTC